MSNNTQSKARQLWKKPNVSINATDLVVEGRYYPLELTRGALVEVVPAPPKDETPQPMKRQSGLSKALTIIGAVFVVLFALLVSWIFDFMDTSSGSKQPYQLVMLGDQGATVALKHTDRKKLTEIAEAVNQALVAQGRRPETASYSTANNAAY